MKNFDVILPLIMQPNNGRLCQQPPTKQSRPYAWGKTYFFKANDTRTHDFFCLDKTWHRGVPTRTEKVKLQNAGLGRKWITFHKKWQFPSSESKIGTNISQVGNWRGVWTVERSSVSPRDLDVIVPPNCGYCVPFLRDSSGLGQAIAYIILIQKDLDCKPL